MSKSVVCRLFFSTYQNVGVTSHRTLLHRSIHNYSSSQINRISWKCSSRRFFSSSTNEQPKPSPEKVVTSGIADVVSSALKLSKEQERKAAVKTKLDLAQWTAIYNFPSIRMAGIIQRLKLYQTAFTCLIVVPTAIGCYNFEIVGEEVIMLTSGVCGLACAMLYVMGSFFSRLIGFIYVSKDDPDLVRIAHMTFWGGRKDGYYKKTDIVPFSDLPDNVKDIYIHVKTYDEPRNPMYISLKYGNVLDKDKFEEIFGGIPELLVTKRKDSKRQS